MPEPSELIFERATPNASRTAILDGRGPHTYRDLLDASARVASVLLAGRGDLNEERVAFLITPGFSWVAVQWGIWRAGGVAVPLPTGSPAAELAYFIHDTGASVLISDVANKETLTGAASECGSLEVRCYDELLAASPGALPEIAAERRAMILYTSGTTSRPKGVVTTHANITAQISSLTEAWEWSADDRILLCLPLHHVHGIINVVSCALWSGAVCEMLTHFDADAVWKRIGRGELTLFMAVPTIYFKLIGAWESFSSDRRAILRGGARETAAHGLRFGCIAGEHAGALARDHRPHLAGTLRHDRDRNGTVESLSWRTNSGHVSASHYRRYRCGWSTIQV